MRQLQTAFDTLLPTEEQKERILCGILLARDDAPRKKRLRSNPVRVAALTAAALALTIVTSSAAEALGISQMIRDYFQQKEESSLMDKFNVAASGLSVAAPNGWKITMTDLFGDENHCYAGVTLEAPAGTVLDRSDYRLYLYTLGDGRTLEQVPDRNGVLQDCNGLADIQDTWFYTEQVPDDNPRDNRISFVCEQILENYQDGAVTNFYFGSLSYREEIPKSEYPPDADPNRTLYRNHMVVDDFQAKIANVATHFSSNSCHMTPNQTIRAFGGETTLSKVSISPLSISFELSGGSIRNLYLGDFFVSEQYKKMTETEREAYVNSFHPTRPERFLSEDYPKICYGWQNDWVCDVPTVLHFKDGTTQELNFLENGRTNNVDFPDKAYAALSFEKLFNLDALDYITICDVRVELPAE